MRPIAAHPPEPASPLTAPAPRLWRYLVHERPGRCFPEDQREGVFAKLEAWARAGGSETYPEYSYLLNCDEQMERKSRRVMAEFSVRETYVGTEYGEILLWDDDSVPWMMTNGMFGLEVQARLRGSNPAAKVKVVTADPQTTAPAQSRAAGAYGLVSKPIKGEKLKVALHAISAGKDS